MFDYDTIFCGCDNPIDEEEQTEAENEKWLAVDAQLKEINENN